MFCFVIAFLDSNYFHKNVRSSITSDYLGNETLVTVQSVFVNIELCEARQNNYKRYVI